MQYTEFGNSGFKTSRFGMGCMRLPLQGDGKNPSLINKEEAIKMIRYAVDNGVNYIDTAFPYHGGQSEAIVCKALKDGYRERVKLATKLPVWLTNTYEDFEKYLNLQLEKLGVEYIDFYLLHALDMERWDKIKKLNVLDFLDKAKEKGKIKHAGFSFHDELPVFKEILDSYNWDMCQIQLNILDEHNQAGVEGLRYAGSRGIPVVIMEPLRGGKLGQKIPHEVKEIYGKYKVQRSPVEWAFRWLYNFPEVAVILSGVSTIEQLKENISIFGEAAVNSMSREELSIIHTVREFYESKTKVGCTGCNYCMPCPSGVSIPEIFSLYNNSSIFDSRDEYAAFYKRYVEKGGDASKCRECGKCQKACPQGISIIEKLKEAHKNLSTV
jgi:Predicted oxidoreductases of the aldo/keto reductase family